ncbi:unnamed protein product [Coffea canephora]|uniref:Uncharacterized protein n=1 Tax=Coffea canephora TaxID=49390 RepID=A0A068TLC8_COFCA|nr:unnamed protein product [Coffea canephora]
MKSLLKTSSKSRAVMCPIPTTGPPLQGEKPGALVKHRRRPVVKKLRCKSSLSFSSVLNVHGWSLYSKKNKKSK